MVVCLFFFQVSLDPPGWPLCSFPTRGHSTGVVFILEQLSGGHADNTVPSPVKRVYVGGNGSTSQDTGVTPAVRCCLPCKLCLDSGALYIYCL